MDGTNFRVPAAAGRRRMCGLSDVLCEKLEDGTIPAGQLPAVWRRINKFGLQGLARYDVRVPNDDAWKRLCRGVSTSARELDLLALMPPPTLAKLPAVILRQLGSGGQELASLDEAGRLKRLCANTLWLREDLASDPLPGNGRAWDEHEAALTAGWFAGPDAEPSPAVLGPLCRLLAREDQLRADPAYFEVPRGKRHWDVQLSGIAGDFEDAVAALRGGRALSGSGEKKPQIVSSLGLIWVKLIRATALRLATRWDDFEDELTEATRDLVYAPQVPSLEVSARLGFGTREPLELEDHHPHATSDSWLILLDKTEFEWAQLERHRATGTGPGSAIPVASWLLPQVSRLSHTLPGVRLVDLENSATWEFFYGQRNLDPAVLGALIDALAGDPQHLPAACLLLQAARSEALWFWISLRRPSHTTAPWTDLARWAQAAWLRGGSDGLTEADADLGQVVEDTQRRVEQMRGALIPGSRTTRLNRWDACQLEESVAALRKTLGTPNTPFVSPLDSPSRRAPDVRTTTRGATSRAATTNQKLSDSLAAIWAEPWSWPGALTLLRQVGKRAGVSWRTLRSRINEMLRHAHSPCDAFVQLKMLSDLVGYMGARQRIRIAASLLEFAKVLRDFTCECTESEAHQIFMRVVGNDGFVPKHEQVLGFPASDLEQWAKFAADHLEKVGDIRGTSELQWAALYAAADLDSPRESRLTRVAAHLDSVRAPDAALYLWIGAAAGLERLVVASLDRLGPPGGETGRSYWDDLGRALRAAVTLREPGTARLIREHMDHCLDGAAQLPLDDRYRLLAYLAVDAVEAGDQQALRRYRDLEDAWSKPMSFPGTAARQLVLAVVARADGSTELELLALRECWRLCSREPSTQWTTMGAEGVRRLLELERQTGHDVIAEMVERRVALTGSRKWLTDMLPSEQRIWLQIANQGDASLESDLMRLDPDDPVLWSELLPSRLVTSLREAITSVTLTSLSSSEPATHNGPLRLADSIWETICEANRGLPFDVWARAYPEPEHEPAWRRFTERRSE